jgi:hypothetical protein
MFMFLDSLASLVWGNATQSIQATESVNLLPVAPIGKKYRIVAILTISAQGRLCWFATTFRRRAASDARKGLAAHTTTT